MNKERSLPSRQMWQAMKDGIEEEILKYDTIGNLIQGVVQHVETENTPLNLQLKEFFKKNPNIAHPKIIK